MGVVAVAALLAGAALWAGGTLRGASAVVAPGEPTRGPDQTAATALASAVREVATSRAQPAGTDRIASAEGASDIVDDPAAPQRDPESLLRALGERRATLLVSRDPRGLAGVDHHGSASWQADARLLTALERNGQRYAGLGVAQVQARTLSFAGDRAVVRARVGLTAYQVIDSAGHAQPRAADPGQDLDVTLVRTPQGWRIESISAPTAT